MVNFGDFTLETVSDGFFRLDGGSMFGVVPKVLWEQTNPPDKKNRIILGLNLLLVRTGEHNALIETGIGHKGDEKFNSIYAIEKRPSFHESLTRVGLKEEDITIVINTHLHFDHAGGNTVKGEDGKFKPAFPNARYYVQKGEWEDATNPNERTKAAYRAEDFVPVMEAGQMELINGEREIIPGISVFKTSGHIKHIQLVKIESQGKTGVYLSDIIPTASHISPPFIAGYDLYPLETLNAKKEIIQKAVAEDWLLFFVHDPEIKAGRVRMKGDRPFVEPADV